MSSSDPPEMHRVLHGRRPGGINLGDGPYGKAAEHLGVIEAELVEPRARGTVIAEMLRKMGYKLP